MLDRRQPGGQPAARSRSLRGQPGNRAATRRRGAAPGAQVTGCEDPALRPAYAPVRYLPLW